MPSVKLSSHSVRFVAKVLQHICRFIISSAIRQLNFVRPRKLELRVAHYSILKEKEGTFDLAVIPT